MNKTKSSIFNIYKTGTGARAGVRVGTGVGKQEGAGAVAREGEGAGAREGLGAGAGAGNANLKGGKEMHLVVVALQFLQTCPLLG